MGNCSYVNQEKSGPSNGWYCNKAGTYVDSSYWRNYCSGSTSYRYCPYLGGDDRFRTSNSTEKDESRSDTNTYSTQTEYSKHSIEGDNDSLYSGGYTGKKYADGSTGSGSATGGGGGLLGIFDYK